MPHEFGPLSASTGVNPSPPYTIGSVPAKLLTKVQPFYVAWWIAERPFEIGHG